ncbi:MAG: hypothetical protein JXA18_15490 [Chitinispirillaceae bacterium]|nr:hypothetical protein [Chitinispirillaceae bacterium]
MEKSFFLLAPALVGGCRDRPIRPAEQVPDNGVSCGSSAITIHGRGGRAKATQGVVYKFMLTMIGYATEESTRSGLKLGEHTFMEPCGDGSGKTFGYLCDECCK